MGTNNLGAATSLNGINVTGVIVGEESDTDADGNEYPIARRWTPAATSDPTIRWVNSTIKVLVGLGGRESSAGSINSKGWIAGWATFKNGLQRAVLWEPTSAAYDLGTLGGAARIRIEDARRSRAFHATPQMHDERLAVDAR